jgi:FtsZ-interacting cell division protein ZipA
MSPATSAAARAPAGPRRAPAPQVPRRVSGPARPRVVEPAGVRLAQAAMRVGDARLLDRLVRGRAWIAIVAAGLLGLVFMQVSMLKLNAGIGRSVASADTLVRQNSALRDEISNLRSDERIQSAAADLGMIMPGASDLHYLRTRRADAARAAASLTPPTPQALAIASGEAPASDGATVAQQQQAQPAQQQQASSAQAQAQVQTQAQAQTQTQTQAQTPAQAQVQAQPAQQQTTTTTTDPAPTAGGATAPQG